MSFIEWENLSRGHPSHLAFPFFHPHNQPSSLCSLSPQVPVSQSRLVLFVVTSSQSRLGALSFTSKIPCKSLFLNRASLLPGRKSGIRCSWNECAPCHSCPQSVSVISFFIPYWKTYSCFPPFPNLSFSVLQGISWKRQPATLFSRSHPHSFFSKLLPPQFWDNSLKSWLKFHLPDPMTWSPFAVATDTMDDWIVHKMPYPMLSCLLLQPSPDISSQAHVRSFPYPSLEHHLLCIFASSSPRLSLSPQSPRQLTHFSSSISPAHIPMWEPLLEMSVWMKSWSLQLTNPDHVHFFLWPHSQILSSGISTFS